VQPSSTWERDAEQAHVHFVVKAEANHVRSNLEDGSNRLLLETTEGPS
jgi:hypothetical protein